MKKYCDHHVQFVIVEMFMTSTHTHTYLFVRLLHRLENIRVVLSRIKLVACVKDRAIFIKALLFLIINVLLVKHFCRRQLAQKNYVGDVQLPLRYMY